MVRYGVITEVTKLVPYLVPLVAGLFVTIHVCDPSDRALGLMRLSNAGLGDRVPSVPREAGSPCGRDSRVRVVMGSAQARVEHP